ncbi:MAG: DUF2235 domain-containing protein [Proteobacteria bacterium]|nr:DUF2235 domain-containing protein [Pseudomonadota bacterium]
MADKQIVILFNGTSNDDKDVAITNIVKLRDGFVQDDDQWIIYHDGIGNDQQWITPLTRLVSQFTGWGGGWIMNDVYKSFLNNIKNKIASGIIQAEDTLHISVSGFSRGAALARHFAIEYINKKCQLDIEKQFKLKLLVKITAEYLFDTVPSFGIPINLWLLQKMGINNQQIDLGWNFNIPTGVKVYHIVATDEHRNGFSPCLIDMKDGEDWHEIWMDGDHSDIGGGHTKKYPNEILSDENPLRYMVKCCQKNNLRFKENFITTLFSKESNLGAIHPSLHLMLPPTQRGPRQIYVKKQGVRSQILPTIAHSVIARMEQNKAYRPEAIKNLEKFYVLNASGEKSEYLTQALWEMLENPSINMNAKFSTQQNTQQMHAEEETKANPALSEVV